MFVIKTHSLKINVNLEKQMRRTEIIFYMQNSLVLHVMVI